VDQLLSSDHIVRSSDRENNYLKKSIVLMEVRGGFEKQWEEEDWDQGLEAGSRVRKWGDGGRKGVTIFLQKSLLS
jgi:hypothetical protein